MTNPYDTGQLHSAFCCQMPIPAQLCPRLDTPQVRNNLLEPLEREELASTPATEHPSFIFGKCNTHVKHSGSTKSFLAPPHSTSSSYWSMKWFYSYPTEVNLAIISSATTISCKSSRQFFLLCLADCVLLLCFLAWILCMLTNCLCIY